MKIHKCVRFENCTRFLIVMCTIAVTSAWVNSVNAAASSVDETQHWEFGISGRFLPAGWFDLSDQWNRDFRAFPAISFAPFVEHRLNQIVSVGISPVWTLNVIPNIAKYEVANMVSASARIRIRYASYRLFEPYALLSAGYSWIRFEQSESATGPVVEGIAGGRLKIWKSHSLFGEVGYTKGYQKRNGAAYAPSYVITGLGWQIAY